MLSTRICNQVLVLGLLAFSAACGRATSLSEVKIVDTSLAQRDLLAHGSLSVDEFEYAQPIDTNDRLFRLVERRVDIRGRLFLPQSSGPAPLIVFLHGNHATCGTPARNPNDPRVDSSVEYTTSGRCPPGMIEAPSYRGYDSSARLLASHGYAVISINANLGINGGRGPSHDPMLVYARGLLVLKHIEALYKATQSENFSAVQDAHLDLRGRLDFSEIGLMGHSRGGEGVRFAHNILLNSYTSGEWQARLPGAKIKGIFEVAPVDSGAPIETPFKTTEAPEIPWTVLIAACDGDLTDYEGVRPYERMLSRADGSTKSILTVWGANHNFFNTEWQTPDSRGCPVPQKALWNTQAEALREGGLAGIKGSAEQEQILKGALLAFFRGHVGKSRDAQLAHVFDPQYQMPQSLTALADMSREIYAGQPNILKFEPRENYSIPLKAILPYVYDQFETIRSYWQKKSQESGGSYINIMMAGEPVLRPAMVLEAPAMQSNGVWIPWTVTRSVEGIWTVDITLALKQVCSPVPNPDSGCAPIDLKGISVALSRPNGTESRTVALKDYVKVENWNDSFYRLSSMSTMGTRIYSVGYASQPLLYQTVRIEIKDFGLSDSDWAKDHNGLVLHFNDTQKLAIALAAVRLTPYK